MAKRVTTIAAGLAEKFVNHPVAISILPLKSFAETIAEQRAKEEIESLRIELESNNMDAEKVAPYPKSNIAGYWLAMGKYELLHAVTSWVHGTHRPGTPRPVTFNASKIENYILYARKIAANQYDAFVYKLCTKIGDCTQATLEGNHIWSYSILTVTKADGSVEQWKTQMIVNCSKFGRYFNQWPSRRINLSGKLTS